MRTGMRFKRTRGLRASLAERYRFHLGDRRRDPRNNHWISLRSRLDKGSARRVGALLKARSIDATLLNKDRSQNIGRIAECGKASYSLSVHLWRAKRLRRLQAERIEQMLSRTGYEPDFTRCV